MEIKQKNILVIGDIMLDIYRTGTVKRISPEAPVPVFNECSMRYVLGGAANVALNLIAAKQNVTLATVIGKDDVGLCLLSELSKHGIHTSCIIESEFRKTTSKTRYLAQNHQQLIRIDVEDTHPLNISESKELFDKIKVNLKDFDLIIFSDYCKGVMTKTITQEIINYAAVYSVPCIADVKDSNYTKYNNMYLIKPNLLELHSLTKLPVRNENEIIYASRELLNKINCTYVLTTCGENGMYFVSRDEVKHIKGTAKEVYDVTGAGDTVISYLGVGIANHLSLETSIHIANVAAGIQVSKIGTSAVYIEEVEKEFGQDIMKKVIHIDSLLSIRERFDSKKIVFTNGCFDVLHSGHITYLEKAKELGDVLIVGLNDDASVKRLKGNQRPFNAIEDRITVLSALYFVDYIIVFSEDTPYALIQKLKPDILVKGSDYKKDEVVGNDVVQSYGGKVMLIDYIEGKSTTRLLKMMGDEIGG